MPGPDNRLVVVNVIDSDRGGGAERLVGELAEEIDGDSARIVNVYFCGQKQGQSAPGKHRGVYLDASGNPIKIIFRLRRLVRDAKKAGYKVLVHAHLVRALYLMPIATSGLGVPLLFSEHNTHNRRRNYIALRWLERFIYSRYAAVVCVSDAVRTNLAAWLRRDHKLVVIDNGVRLLTFQKRAFRQGEPVRFASVGSLKPAKGFDLAIRALAGMEEIDWRYTIVGTGPDAEQLRQMAVTLGVEDRVEFAGWTDDVEPFLKASDIQLVPSRWEGFGLVAVEGMSTGIMVVASDVPGLRDVVGADGCGGLLVSDPASIEAWRASIRLALDELRLRREHHAPAARMKAERFTLQKTAEAHLSLYRAISGLGRAAEERSSPK